MMVPSIEPMSTASAASTKTMWRDNAARASILLKA